MSITPIARASSVPVSRPLKVVVYLIGFQGYLANAGPQQEVISNEMQDRWDFTSNHCTQFRNGLTERLERSYLNTNVKIVNLEELLNIFPEMLKGKTFGRTLVDLNK